MKKIFFVVIAVFFSAAAVSAGFILSDETFSQNSSLLSEREVPEPMALVLVAVFLIIAGLIYRRK